MRHAVNRISLTLSLACFGTLAVGLVIEVFTGGLLSENYISAFTGWGFVLAMIYSWTQRPRDHYPDLGL